MKIVKASFNERTIVDGCLFQKARLTVRLAPDAMKLFDKNREQLRESFGVMRIDWCRFVPSPSGAGKESHIAHSVATFETEYEITLIGTAEMEPIAQNLLNWISTVGRLTETSPVPVAKVELMSIYPEQRNPRSIYPNPIIGIGSSIV